MTISQGSFPNHKALSKMGSKMREARFKNRAKRGFSLETRFLAPSAVSLAFLHDYSHEIRHAKKFMWPLKNGGFLLFWIQKSTLLYFSIIKITEPC